MDPFYRLGDAVVDVSPFPHTVLPALLDQALMDTLVRELPTMDVLSGGRSLKSYERLHCPEDFLLEHPRISPTWKSVVRAAMDQSFFDKMVKLFSPHIHAAYPDFEKHYGPLEQLEVLPASDVGAKRSTVTMSVQLAVHAPLHRGHVVGYNEHGPHVDRENKLFVAALYFRTGLDQSEGGGLDLYEPCVPRLSFGPKRTVPRSQLRTVKTVPYRRNTLVALLNTRLAVHGVAPRGTTPEARYGLLISGRLSRKLFRPETGTALIGAAIRSKVRAVRHLWRK